jgi:hypothetical protein
MDILVSTSAFKSNLRRYSAGPQEVAVMASSAAKLGVVMSGDANSEGATEDEGDSGGGNTP